MSNFTQKTPTAADRAMDARVTEKEQSQTFSTGRRRVPRRPINRRVGLLVKGAYHLARSYEIGEGGMLVDSPVALEQGQRLVISFRIPGVLHGVMLARVVYVIEPKGPGQVTKYGVQFDKVDFDVKRKIRNFVASNVSQQNSV